MRYPIRNTVFFPPFILILIAAVASIIYPSFFLGPLTDIHHWLLYKLGKVYSSLSFIMIVVSVSIMISPFRNLKIGGNSAKPDYSFWQWALISVSATEACGMVFWGLTEPLIHYNSPAHGVSLHNASFAMSAVFLHWTLTPYAIYCLPALLFALVYHHYRYPFSLASCFYPLLGEKKSLLFSKPLEALSLYALAIGMAASFATGVLVMLGGIAYLFGINKSPTIIGLLTAFIVITFVTMSALGVKKALRHVATLKLILILVLIAYVLYFASKFDVMSIGFSGIQYYMHHFLALELWPILHPDDKWGYQWSVFLWAIWMGWAPISAMFLGNLAKGRTVFQFMLVNLVIPLMVNLLWMWLFGGFSLSFPNLNLLSEVLMLKGPEGVAYYIFSQYPGSLIIISIFLVTIFVAFVISADANTQVMAAVSVEQSDNQKMNSPLFMQILWGGLLGIVVFLVLNFSGLDGIKMLANFSAIPIILVLIMMLLSLMKIIFLTIVKPWFENDVLHLE